jgi:hypothetical protein
LRQQQPTQTGAIGHVRRPSCGAEPAAHLKGWPAPPPDRGRGAGIHPVRPHSTPASALCARRLRRGCVRKHREAGSRRSCRRASGVGGSARSQATAGPREFGCAHLCCRRWGATRSGCRRQRVPAPPPG